MISKIHPTQTEIIHRIFLRKKHRSSHFFGTDFFSLFFLRIKVKLEYFCTSRRLVEVRNCYVVTVDVAGLGRFECTHADVFDLLEQILR
jgi:hypothetical protein